MLAALLALSGASVFAADYFVVIPVKNKTVNLSAISVALNAGGLPGAKVGYAFSYDFKTNLQVTGDSTYTGYGVSWAVTAGSLPAGLVLNASTGVLSGTPTTAGSTNFTVSATYKTKPGAQPYTVVVANVQAVVALQANTDANFGAVTVGNSVSKSFTVTNSGDGPATGVYAQVIGTDLALTANTCGTSGSQQTVAANNGTCAVTVQYTPTGAGTLSSAALNLFVGNVAGSPFSLPLSGSAALAYPVASGGTVTAPGDGYQYHAYTATGANTFTVTSAGGQDFDVLVIAGGGGGGAGRSGNHNPGGGGAGGLLFQTVKLTAGTYSLSVGAGGASMVNGSNSQFSGTGVSLVALGGGAGGGDTSNPTNGFAGGSGGGGGGSGSTVRAGGAGTAGQGYAGGSGIGPAYGGGGGGAGGAGVNGTTTSPAKAGVGGVGRYIPQFSSYGVAGYFAGGGGGGDGSGRAGGQGGGGAASLSGAPAGAGVANTGSGGGAGTAAGNTYGGAGGSGVVLIRYAKP